MFATDDDVVNLNNNNSFNQFVTAVTNFDIENIMRSRNEFSFNQANDQTINTAIQLYNNKSPILTQLHPFTTTPLINKNFIENIQPEDLNIEDDSENEPVPAKKKTRVYKYID